MAAVAVVIAPAAIAAARSRGGLPGVLSALREYPFWFCLQLAGALGLALLIAWALSAVGFLARRLLRDRHGPGGERRRLVLAAESVIAGLVFIGLALGRDVTHTYHSPHNASCIELRRPAWIETPLGMSSGSDCLVPVIMTFRDETGRATTRHGSEFKNDDPVELLAGRSIRWSTGGPPRAMVGLIEAQGYFFFPDDVQDEHQDPPASAMDAFLRGEPIAQVNQLIRDARRSDP